MIERDFALGEAGYARSGLDRYTTRELRGCEAGRVEPWRYWLSREEASWAGKARMNQAGAQRIHACRQCVVLRGAALHAVIITALYALVSDSMFCVLPLPSLIAYAYICI